MRWKKLPARPAVRAFSGSSVRVLPPLLAWMRAQNWLD